MYQKFRIYRIEKLFLLFRLEVCSSLIVLVNCNNLKYYILSVWLMISLESISVFYADLCPGVLKDNVRLREVAP